METSSFAWDINDSGEVVGSFIDSSDGRDGFYYKYGGDPPVKLNDLLGPNQAWSLTVARGINNNGIIVGTGLAGYRAFYMFSEPPKMRKFL
jgi:uncharacterized membrane protein